MAADGPAVRALGEIALRVRDLDVMQAFYEDTIGLPLFDRRPNVVFFDLGESFGGHTAVLALFDRDVDTDAARSTLDHLAFTIDVADYESEQARLEAAGLDVVTATHQWVAWRSLYVEDPEENTVELVCHDPEIDE